PIPVSCCVASGSPFGSGRFDSPTAGTGRVMSAWSSVRGPAPHEPWSSRVGRPSAGSGERGGSDPTLSLPLGFGADGLRCFWRAVHRSHIVGLLGRCRFGLRRFLELLLRGLGLEGDLAGRLPPLPDPRSLPAEL